MSFGEFTGVLEVSGGYGESRYFAQNPVQRMSGTNYETLVTAMIFHPSTPFSLSERLDLFRGFAGNTLFPKIVPNTSNRNSGFADQSADANNGEIHCESSGNRLDITGYGVP